MISIGELARLTDTCPENIRYFEKQGLLPRTTRSEGGHRLYTERHEKILTFILRARKLGFSPDEVRQLLTVIESEEPCGQVREVARRHLTDIRRRRLELQRMERMLASLVRRCDERAPTEIDCPVVEKLQEPISGN